MSPLRPAPAPWSVRLVAAVALLVVGAGAWLRVEQARVPFLFGDELHSLRLVGAGYPEVVRSFDAFGSGLGLPLLQKLSIDLAGTGHLALRAVALGGGLLALLLTVLVGRRLAGAAVGLGAAVLLSLSGYHLYYSGFGRSYALVSAVALLYVGAVSRLVGVERPGRRQIVPVLLSAAALPWLHLTALAVVAPVVAVVGAELAASRRRAPLVALLGAHAGAALIALAVHLPAWEGVSAFVASKSGGESAVDFTALDVGSLLAGGRTGALIGIGLLTLGWIGLARERSALPLLAGCFGPVLVLALVRPYGDPYAYARYLIGAQPLAMLVIAWGGARLLARLGSSGALAVLVPCLALGVGAAADGWLPPFGVGPPRFAATYLSLLPLPAFDAPWPGCPELYRRLGADPDVTRVVEVPWLKKRTVHLYRNHALQHGKDVVLGLLPDEGPLLPEGPYVRLLAPDWRRQSGAELLIVHRDVLAEVDRYWTFVEAVSHQAGADPRLAAFMQRHQEFGRQVARVDEALLEALTAELGEPLQRDEQLVVWRL